MITPVVHTPRTAAFTSIAMSEKTVLAKHFYRYWGLWKCKEQIILYSCFDEIDVYILVKIWFENSKETIFSTF